MKRRRRKAVKAKAAPAAAPDPTWKYHFLNLPGEIRNSIYEYCIQGEITVEILTTNPIKSIQDWPENWKFSTFEGLPGVKQGKVRKFALFKTCRQIRYETLPILARLGHTCLYVDILGAFKAELMEVLPAAYTANIREIRLWKFVPSLNSQTLTTALPQLQRIVLEYATQTVADVVGHIVSWPLAELLASDTRKSIKSLISRLYTRERKNLTRSAPDRQVALSIRAPFGRFDPTNNTTWWESEDVTADNAIVAEANENETGELEIQITESPIFAQFHRRRVNGGGVSRRRFLHPTMNVDRGLDTGRVTISRKQSSVSHRRMPYTVGSRRSFGW